MQSPRGTCADGGGQGQEPGELERDGRVVVEEVGLRLPGTELRAPRLRRRVGPARVLVLFLVGAGHGCGFCGVAAVAIVPRASA